MSAEARLLDSDEALPSARQVFQTAAWRRCVESLGFGSFALALDGQARLFFETRRALFRCAGSPLRGSMTPYMPPLGRELSEPDATEEYLRSLRAAGYDWIEFGRLEPDPELERWARQAGAEFLPRRTSRVALSRDEGAMWDALDKRARNMARKAERLGVAVRELAGTPAELDEFYAMLRVTFARSGARPPQPPAFFRALGESLVPAGGLTFLAAEHEGRRVSMGLFARDAREAHFVSGASLPEAGPLAANTLLHWELMRRCGRAGVEVYDLGGLGIPAIDKFKESLGGREHSFQWLAWRTPAARACEAAYRRAKPVWDGLRRMVRP